MIDVLNVVRPVIGQEIVGKVVVDMVANIDGLEVDGLEGGISYGLW